MNKRYQVFISSTYIDLIEERQLALKAVLDTGNIPSAMEGFFATDEEQLKYVKKVIDQCDYYVLVIAGKYGSVDKEGVSYTEREFHYAVSKGIPVLVFPHGDIAGLSDDAIEVDRVKAHSLKEFTANACTGRVAKFWTTKQELQYNLVVSLMQFINENPRIGWVRGDTVASEDLLSQLNDVRSQLAARTEELSQSRNDLHSLKVGMTPDLSDIASLDDQLSIHFVENYVGNHGIQRRDHTRLTTWADVFIAIGPKIITPFPPTIINTSLNKTICEDRNFTSIKIRDSDLDRIKIHLAALKLVKVFQAVNVGGGTTEWVQVTELGKSVLTERLAARKPSEGLVNPVVGSSS